jgi:hypothetical protein
MEGRMGLSRPAFFCRLLCGAFVGAGEILTACFEISGVGKEAGRINNSSYWLAWVLLVQLIL